MQIATGAFDVKTLAEPLCGVAAQTALGRMSIDKVYRGAMEGTSQGEMLFAMGAAKGSGGYVAMERVTGTVDGRSGSFALQHSGTMASGTQTLSIIVVPDSGTEELVGLTGSMNISTVDGVHRYEFQYTLVPEVNEFV
jgi:hypothetical protein